MRSRNSYSPSTGNVKLPYIAPRREYGRYMPEFPSESTSYASCDRRFIRRTRRVGFGGTVSPYTARREIFSAACMYFSINIGETDSTSPLLSKP